MQQSCLIHIQRWIVTSWILTNASLLAPAFLHVSVKIGGFRQQKRGKCLCFAKINTFLRRNNHTMEMASEAICLHWHSLACGWKQHVLDSDMTFKKLLVKREICQWYITKHIRFLYSSNIPYHRCIMCFTFCNAFCPPTQRASVCVFTDLRIIRIVFLPRKAHLRPKGPIAVSWARQPTKRQRAGENILPKWAMREIRAWISLVSSETVHPDRYECPSSGLGGRGASAFCRKMGICYGLLFMFLMTSW